MLDISVETENDQRHLRVTEEQLGALVRRIGGEGDRFLVVQRIPDLPDVFLQVWHADGGGYTLEHRDGAVDRHFQVELDGPGPVVAAMTGWARQEARWSAGHAWSRLDLGPVPGPAPAPEPAEDEHRLLVERLRELLVGGCTTRAELAATAEEYLVRADRRPLSPEQARQLADRIWLERVEEQAGWEGETDAERLTRAFAALEAVGVTARENFTCCRTCGESEIGTAGAPDARGFVYFPTRCTDSAAAGHGLDLLYGGFDGAAGTTAAIGREVVAALAAVGLPTRWDGDPARAVTVTPRDRRRRLVG
ncbi:hypothetical protein AB0K43_00980 [Kitasatospora sp. NPDC049258]|uniref:DUF6891 domain-containing protein n=1 Tax=Kitasatospora sp. NPDC049258 TaxID=3155394 RepID=UPI0034132227